MRTPRFLPGTDLANIAPLETEEKYRQLLRFKGGHPSWSYDPARRCIPDILNAGGSLFPSSGETPIEVLRAKLLKACAAKPDGIQANLEVVQLAYDDHRRHPRMAIQHSFGQSHLGPGLLAAYWSDVFMHSPDDGVLIPHYDFRREHGLNRVGIKFAASVMHHHITAAYAEFSTARLLHIQFPAHSGERSIRQTIIGGGDLFTYLEIGRMVQETHAMLVEINNLRDDERRGTGTSGHWFE